MNTNDFISLYFERYAENGDRLYKATVNGVDPIGEFITLDDDFLTGREYKIYSDSADLRDIVLPMLKTPKISDAEFIVQSVITYNDIEAFNADLDFFSECASLMVIELGL